MLQDAFFAFAVHVFSQGAAQAFTEQAVGFVFVGEGGPVIVPVPGRYRHAFGEPLVLPYPVAPGRVPGFGQ